MTETFRFMGTSGSNIRSVEDNEPFRFRRELQVQRQSSWWEKPLGLGNFREVARWPSIFEPVDCDLDFSLGTFIFIIITIICSCYTALYPRTSSKLFTYYYPQHTCTHQYILNSSTEHTTRIHATGRHGWSMYNSFLCVLPGSCLRLSEL